MRLCAGIAVLSLARSSVGQNTTTETVEAAGGNVTAADNATTAAGAAATEAGAAGGTTRNVVLFCLVACMNILY